MESSPTVVLGERFSNPLHPPTSLARSTPPTPSDRTAMFPVPCSMCSWALPPSTAVGLSGGSMSSSIVIGFPSKAIAISRSGLLGSLFYFCHMAGLYSYVSMLHSVAACLLLLTSFTQQDCQCGHYITEQCAIFGANRQWKQWKPLLCGCHYYLDLSVSFSCALVCVLQWSLTR